MQRAVANKLMKVKDLVLLLSSKGRNYTVLISFAQESKSSRHLVASFLGMYKTNRLTKSYIGQQLQHSGRAHVSQSRGHGFESPLGARLFSIIRG